jgi:hypothetical protein
VWVRPYVREGRPVVGHWRGAPAGSGGLLVPIAKPSRTDPNTGVPEIPGRGRGILEGPPGGGYGGSGAARPRQPAPPEQPQPSWRPSPGEVSPAAANSPPGARIVRCDQRPGQLQRKYKHAEEFGLPRNWNPTNGERFQGAIRMHVEIRRSYESKAVFGDNPLLTTSMQIPDGS